MNTMPKKYLLFALLITVAVSPLLPRASADSTWKTLTDQAVWEYPLYRVERLAMDAEFQGPYEYADSVFFTTPTDACKQEACSDQNMTLFRNGKVMTIANVTADIQSPFWSVAQDGRFLYRAVSSDKSAWYDVFEYDAKEGSTTLLKTIKRQADDFSFLTLATDNNRLYASVLREEPKTGKVETELSVYDYVNGYERHDFTYALTAPWQQIVDVHDGLALVKFQFEGGYKQLWLVDETARSMKEIPKTWTESPGDIVGAHFRANGEIAYFQNYRFYTYDPETQTGKTYPGVHLSWNAAQPDELLQIAGNRAAWLNEHDVLYVSNLDGVFSLGAVVNRQFRLEQDAVYFHSPDGYFRYAFQTKTTQTEPFFVTDEFGEVRIGIDESGNIWYKNQRTDYVIQIGYGTNPVLSDREHALWRGEDGEVYQATFSPALALEKPEIQAYRAAGSLAVYAVSENKIWSVPNPDVYFTWFDSWANVMDVSAATLDAYQRLNVNKGVLQFAPGTRLKAVGNPRVYVVGSDSHLHWIISETVAKSIYGSYWKQEIREVHPSDLWNYKMGSDVKSADEIRKI